MYIPGTLASSLLAHFAGHPFSLKVLLNPASLIPLVVRFKMLVDGRIGGCLRCSRAKSHFCSSHISASSSQGIIKDHISHRQMKKPIQISFSRTIALTNGMKAY